MNYYKNETPFTAELKLKNGNVVTVEPSESFESSEIILKRRFPGFSKWSKM